MYDFILYSFRRCPYAIRCRMVLEYCQFPYTLREVFLKDMPAALLELSRKEHVTVPVLYSLQENILLEESWAIMKWVFEHTSGRRNRYGQWWLDLSSEQQYTIEYMRNKNDTLFKYHLDRYKYPNRYEKKDSVEEEEIDSRCECTELLQQYENQLACHSFLLGDFPTVGDVVVMSFIRQFAHVDVGWFQKNLKALSKWLDHWESDPIFMKIMDKKYRGVSPIGIKCF